VATRPSGSAYPSMPRSGLRKVSSRSVEVFVTSRAAWTSSLRSTSTPSPRASGAPATRTALTRFSPASELRPVAGRCDPTSTTGVSTLSVRFKKYAVSSSVAVPCVITTPSSGASRETASCTAASSASQSAGPTAALDIAGHQINTVHSDLVGHQTLAAPEDHVRRVDDVDDALQLLDHGVGVPGDDLVGGMGLFVAEAGAAGGDIGRPHARLLTPALRRRPAHVPRGLQPVAGRGPPPSPPLPPEGPAPPPTPSRAVARRHPQHRTPTA